ncbi:unnamed protein product [Soboliphyme baturini]|uniref:Protein kinase domain-containing protein n=1 Tax=Soboliphyme baturini TaxID=241478 RepID=A0A183IM58_9BILA|nr:unnamed protein product [Soboliphyme baturini]
MDVLQVIVLHNPPKSIYHKYRLNGSSLLQKSVSKPNSAHFVQAHSSGVCDIKSRQLRASDGTVASTSNGVKRMQPVAPAAVARMANAMSHSGMPPIRSVMSSLPISCTPLSCSEAQQPCNSLQALSINDTVMINSKKYTVLSLLGTGGSSQVYQIFDPVRRTCLALKCVNLSGADESVITVYKNEIFLLTRLRNSASVVNMLDYEYTADGQYLLMVLEKGDTDLGSFIQSRSERPSLAMIAYYWMEMLKAVKVIHEQGIVHADLKPSNFLLVGGNLKLIDFGISDQIPDDRTWVTKQNQMGTLNYISPEAISSENPAEFKLKVSFKTDVWSLGCILYKMVYGKTPFQDIPSVAGKLLAITNPEVAIEFPDVGDKNLTDVMEKCLQRNQRLRPTINELMRHPFVTSCAPRQQFVPFKVSDETYVQLAEEVLGSSPITAASKIKAFCTRNFNESISNS